MTALVIDPDVQVVLDMIKAANRPPFASMTPPQAREVYAAGRAVLQPDPEPVPEVRDLAATGPGGTVPMRLYRGEGAHAAEPGPALVFFHGGGWVIGSLDSHDQVCRAIANRAGIRVLSVDYRLAPEHKFPAAIEDSAAGVRFAFEQAAALGIDPARIAVGGDSAGGNIAAALALLARDGALPPIAFQVLIYPVTDLAMTSDAYRRVTDTFPLTASSMAWFCDHYLSRPADAHDWRASPLRAPTLAGVAPALVLTAAHDPLSDEGADYAKRLEREGVRVLHAHFSDQMHGFMTMGRVIRASGMAIDLIASALRRAFDPRVSMTP